MRKNSDYARMFIILLVSAIVAAMMVAAFFWVADALAQSWEDPKVAEACGSITVIWDNPPAAISELGELAGTLWVDEIPYNLSIISDNPPTFSTGVPMDAKFFEGMVYGDKYAGVIVKQPIRCERAWLPLQLNR